MQQLKAVVSCLLCYEPRTLARGNPNKHVTKNGYQAVDFVRDYEGQR